jgi:MaoC like domain
MLRTYLRFLFSRRPGLASPSDLPSIRAQWNGIHVCPRKLQQYRLACKTEGEPGLPAHYPHVLASALHLTMLTEPEFPLRMLGALHLRNHVIRYRRIESEETLDLAADMGKARFRPQGIEFDLNTELKADGERVWAERTTFLVRKKLQDESPPSELAEIYPWNEEEQREWSRFEVPAHAGRRFAAITGDYNPIHISRLMARLFGFKRDLVHGMWGVARATAGQPLLQSGDPVRIDVAFKGPLYMENEVVVRESDCRRGRSLRLYCGREARPAVLVVVQAVDHDARPETVN